MTHFASLRFRYIRKTVTQAIFRVTGASLCFGLTQSISTLTYARIAVQDPACFLAQI
jgi:hypothetical protein